MIVIEFYLKTKITREEFPELVDAFIKIPTPPEPFTRKFGGTSGPAVYAVSYNPDTGWVQLLVDNNVPDGILTAIRSKASELAEKIAKDYVASHDHIAPLEEKPEEKAE